MLLASPMSSQRPVRVGSQLPRLHSTPTYSHGVGQEAVEFMAQIGRPLDEWQAWISTDMFGINDEGLWAAFEVVLLLSRQNGKGAVAECRELFGLFQLREKLILHSAHLFRTSAKHFKKVVELVDGNDWLRKQVHRIDRGKGSESIQLMSRFGGGQLDFIARTLGAGRGETGDCTVFDEAAWLTVGQYQAQTPTLATVQNPQIHYHSTPPDEDVGPMPDDAMLPSVRKRGKSAADRVLYAEWSPEPGSDRSNPDVWYSCNPSAYSHGKPGNGRRIAEWFLRKQHDNFVAAGKLAKFSTEHLGEWPDEGGPQWSVISKADWDRAADPLSQAKDPVVFAMYTTWERTHTSVAAVGERADGNLHAVIVDHRIHGDWPVKRMVELALKWKPAAIILDPSGATNSMLEPLNRALKTAEATDWVGNYLQVTPLTAREAAAGWGMVHDALSSRPRPHSPDEEVLPAGKRLFWRSDVFAEELTTAVKSGTKRSLGEGFAWECKTEVVMSPIKAVTDAVYGFVTRPAEVVQPWVFYE